MKLDKRPPLDPETAQNLFGINKIHDVNHSCQKQQSSYVASLAASNGQRFFDLSSYINSFSMFLNGSYLKVLILVYFNKI